MSLPESIQPYLDEFNRTFPDYVASAVSDLNELAKRHELFSERFSETRHSLKSFGKVVGSQIAATELRSLCEFQESWNSRFCQNLNPVLDQIYGIIIKVMADGVDSIYSKALWEVLSLGTFVERQRLQVKKVRDFADCLQVLSFDLDADREVLIRTEESVRRIADSLEYGVTYLMRLKILIHTGRDPWSP